MLRRRPSGAAESIGLRATAPGLDLRGFTEWSFSAFPNWGLLPGSIRNVLYVTYPPSTRGVPMGLVAPRAVLVEDLEVVFGGEVVQPDLLPMVEL